MADASGAFTQGDVMNKLGGEVEQLMRDKEAMKDPNRKEASDSEEDSSSDDDRAGKDGITFISAIDVGSHFIDVSPSEEIEF